VSKDRPFVPAIHQQLPFADVDVTDMQDGMGNVGGVAVVVDVVDAKGIPPI
jgi:hypothetical protein